MSSDSTPSPASDPESAAPSPRGDPEPSSPAPPYADPQLKGILVAALEKMIKAASWRKAHSRLSQQCKSLLDLLSHPNSAVAATLTPFSPNSSSSLPGRLLSLSLSDSELLLSPFVAALSSSSPRVVEPALDAIQKLVSHSYLHGEADSSPNSTGPSSLLSNLFSAVCDAVNGSGNFPSSDEPTELLVLKTLLTAVTSSSVRLHGDCLLRAVRACYDVYLGSRSMVNQTTAKASLVQILVIVFRRMEADSSSVPVQPVVVADLIEPANATAWGNGVERSESDLNFVQGIITKVTGEGDNTRTPGWAKSAHDGAFETTGTVVEATNATDLLDSTDKDMLDAKYWEISMYKTALEGRKDELGTDGTVREDDDAEVRIGNKFRRDSFLVFRAMCKLSMKTPPKEAANDPGLIRGKVIALELLKILLENAGAVFRTSDRFLGAIKQYLCLSLLKNSTSGHMIVFQLSCSIFMSLVSRFRPGLKAEIGVFFPMIILRVLENVAQPNFQQKMTVLSFLEKLCMDSQILVDIFINYDCDVHSPNIFERMVNGLLKTAQGPPSGMTTTLLPPHDAVMKTEATKCLVAVLKSMGDWMNKQLRLPDPQSNQEEKDGKGENKLPQRNSNGESSDKTNARPEQANGTADVMSIEERRAYKLELLEGIALFNRKPKKGIEFLVNVKKVGESPEEIAAFLKGESGLNKTMVGDYLGEREDTPLKVMHAYVDSFDFVGMEFDEAIRLFLRGFRLPGEAQKIDRIMEKFAERYCKCNPRTFSSADTAYVLAYSVILLNTDAHNPMVKNKMSADDFIRNNRGIDDGKDLPEEFMRSLFERITKKEIKMKEDDFSSQQKQSSSSNKILALDNVLNIIVRKQDLPMERSDDLIKHMQDQLREKARKSESAYYVAADVVILKFMIEVCWPPMLAAFSVPLGRSDDQTITSLCLEGFRGAVHLTAVMAMKTQRDAFVTSLAKFTSLHSAADIKQKNIDAIKTILMIADEDGNYLQGAWEHVLTCISRYEHLHLLGEGTPPDAAFFAVQVKNRNPPFTPRRGSYDSAGVGGYASGAVTAEQVSMLNLMEQVGMADVNCLFTQSEKLNSEAIVDFVKALCKVSIDELSSTSAPRVFSLTKIVEIAHYNMTRIRLVWSSIWRVLSAYFVTIGCSENLSIAIFAMDSLRQLAMKFLEREELANYNFQNEFLKPFVVVMRKSGAVEIRELIIRCVSQMVLARVGNVKSGWKSMFMVFATASCDDHKNIVLLAFEIIEKILQEYFPYITETETSSFTDCINCLVAFTNSRFDRDVSLNAIGFLRFCAAKLAEGDIGAAADKDYHVHLWFPLLAGLSELTFDLRPEIRKSALQVLFDTLRNHGHIFSLPLWEKVFDSILFRIFDYVRHTSSDMSSSSRGQSSETDPSSKQDQDAWLYETCTLALQLVVDLFVKFYDTVNPLLRKVLALLVSFIERSHQSLAGIGIAALVRLLSSSGSLLTEDKWLEVVSSLNEAAEKTLPDFSFVNEISTFSFQKSDDEARASGSDDIDDDHHLDNLYRAIGDAKCRSSVQLLLIQAVMEIYNMHRDQLSAANTLTLFKALQAVAVHAHSVNSNDELRGKLHELGSATQIQDPPLLRLENESYQLCFTLLQNLILDKDLEGDPELEGYLVDLCKQVLQVYLSTSGTAHIIPAGSSKRRELTARGPVVVSALQAVSNLGDASLQKNLPQFFPLLSALVSCEHGSKDVPDALCDVFDACVGPILLQSC